VAGPAPSDRKSELPGSPQDLPRRTFRVVFDARHRQEPGVGGAGNLDRGVGKSRSSHLAGSSAKFTRLPARNARLPPRQFGRPAAHEQIDDRPRLTPTDTPLPPARSMTTEFAWEPWIPVRRPGWTTPPEFTVRPLTLAPNSPRLADRPARVHRQGFLAPPTQADPSSRPARR